MDKSLDTQLRQKMILEQWKRMIKGLETNPDILSNEISQSWRNSLKNKVDPYKFDKSILLTKEEIRVLTKLDDMEEEYGDIIHIIKDIADKMELTFTVFDANGHIKKILAIPNSFDDTGSEIIIIKETGEDRIGTNAVSLALKGNKAVQLYGPEHFNFYLHEGNCSAAPIHDVHNRVIGAINISSFKQKQTLVALGLVKSIAKFLDSCMMVNYMMNNLSFCSFSLKESMEYLPNGVIFNNYQTGSIDYNKNVLKMLKIENKDKTHISQSLIKYKDEIDSIRRDRDLSNEEILLKTKGRKTSFIITTKNIFDADSNPIGEMVTLQETDKLLRLKLLQRGNEAMYTFDDIIGKSEEILRTKKMAKQISSYSSSILIHGESGTGKEMFAQAIHNESNRSNNAFVAINCGAIPSELIESELFGYEPGAFTGALKGGKIGKLELASEGTLFLDEIESMPLDVQIKLLRALSTNSISRIGGLENIPFDVRIISATKKDLLKESDLGNFREDLYFRLNVINLKLPPLRERKKDICLLAEKFVNMFSKKFSISNISMDTHFKQALDRYYWRGNVRELKNILERAVLLNKEGELSLEDLPDKIRKSYRYKTLRNELVHKFNDDYSGENLLKSGEEIIIEHVLKSENFNMSRAAERLGISRPTLYSKIRNSTRLDNAVKKFNTPQ